MIRTQRNSHPIAQGAAAGMLAVAVAMSAGLASAADAYDGQHSTETKASRFGINAAATGLTMLYAPVKLTYSALGLVFGGIAYGLSGGDGDVLRAVVTPAIEGDFVVLPEHIRRQEAIEFVGRDPAYREDQVVDAAVVEEVY